jgi:superfamily II DNA or RNA helicase
MITRNNVWCYTTDSEVRNILKFRPDGYYHVEAYKKGYWDGWKHLAEKDVKRARWRFPAGLFKHVSEQIPQAIADVRVKPTNYLASMATTQKVSLIPEQEAVVQLALQHEQGILQAPTGVGKGRIMGEIIRRLRLRALVIVDKKDLMYQLQNEIGACLGRYIGIAGDGQFDDSDIMVATVQTLRSSKFADRAFFDHFGVVIVDEAHHATSESMQSVLQQIDAHYRFGLSATPFKEGDRGTFLMAQAFLGPLLARVTTAQGVAAGRIVGADIFMIDGIGPMHGTFNYQQQYNISIVNNPVRNKAIVNIATMMVGPTVILVERVEHGELLEAALNAPFVHGGVHSKTRKMVYERFRLGLTPVLIIGKLGNEALDLPNLDCLINAGGGKASYVVTQKVGRALRSSPGKTRATVFDFMDNARYLDKHSRARLRTYQKEPAFKVHLINKEELGL